ncbi:hypothetical protein [uncultured Olegusella sp.]|uniref:hypothetical protein n=1 Tax=uncultured Olegusella sp. TaxID=1979846 RepID=UPI002624522A|nr:hypothetical protein [uncultured Olegusella sp.]
MSDNTLALPVEQQGALEVRKQVNAIQYLMKDVLQEGTHYGTIKGCGPKPTLLQAGAEKIAYMFHFVPTYTIDREDYDGGHRSYDVTCTLTNRDTGQVMGYGVGECSTLESKYRYRWTGYNENRRKEENPDIADVWNTVKKMAKKRAFVDAVKSTTAASDIFTQDIEDMPNLANVSVPQMQPQQHVMATVESVPASYEPPKPKQSSLKPETREFMRDASEHYAQAHGITPNEAAHMIIDACGAPIDSDAYLQTVGNFVMGAPVAPAAGSQAKSGWSKA